MTPEEIISSPLVQPYLSSQLSSKKQVTIPISYPTRPTESQIIKDLIHLKHPIFQSIQLIDKKTSPLQLPPAHFNKFPTLSPRKSYEIDQFAKYIQFINTTKTPFEFIIDVGAGKSYLGRSLAPHFSIISVEHDLSKISTSRTLSRFDNNITGAAGLQVGAIHHVRDLNFGAKTLNFINSRKKINGSIPRALIVGLDVCGDLPNLIMSKTVNGIEGLEIVGCCFVSCCYHKVGGFVSNKLRETTQMRFDELGYFQDLRFLKDDEVLLAFKKEYYKEVLIEIIGDDGIDLTTLRNTDFTSWESFITRIGEINGLEQYDQYFGRVNHEEFISHFITWCYVRGFLSQVIETLVHHDRVEFLENNGCSIVSTDILFDFNKSSRNVLLTGIK